MNNNTNNVPRLIYVMGIDGSGKSTVSEYLADQLREKGYEVDILWLRFNHVFSKPLLGFCRIFGYTKYETVDGIRVGYHNFQNSNMVSLLFILFQYLDALRVKYLKILPRLTRKNTVLILDRYVYDILIDIAVDTGRKNLLFSWIGRKFIALLPQDSITILVHRDLSDVLEVRPEGKVDRNFKQRYEHFQALHKSNDINVINNSGSLDELLSLSGRIVGVG